MTSPAESAPVRPSEPTGTASRTLSGWGLATLAADGSVLDVWYPAPALGPLEDQETTVRDLLEQAASADEARGTTQEVLSREVDLDQAPQDAADAWLRLHALSHRLAAPNTLNLDGVFGLLTNVVWTSQGPCAVADFELTRLRLRARGPLAVFGVDKFPRMTDYVVPSGVRIGDADRVRLGAHLSPGTTVMHEGFVNFNAGTLGTSMVEGRISAGVVVEDGSDVGGGASIMGTLSGGGTQRITIGRRVLLGANSGVGISVGDDCVVEAGLYLTAGMLVEVVGTSAADADAPDDGGARHASTGFTADQPRLVKAVELSGVPNLLFRRDSASGRVQALPRAGQSVELNSALHAN